MSTPREDPLGHITTEGTIFRCLRCGKSEHVTRLKGGPSFGPALMALAAAFVDNHKNCQEEDIDECPINRGHHPIARTDLEEEL